MGTRVMLREKAGFTLLEILIVLVIISIVASIAALSITHNHIKQEEYLADELVNLMTLLQEEAMLRPATLAMGFTPTAFQVYEYHSQTKKHPWQVLTISPFGIHAIPSTIQIQLQMQDENILLEGQPQLIISASGDLTPFKLFIGEKNKRPAYEIIGTESGDIKWDVFHEE